MSHQILLCFSTVDFEHDFMMRKVELGKNGKNLAMTNCEPFLLILRYYFKTSLQYMFEGDCITYEDIKSFNICFC